MIEDKVFLTRKRVELVEILTTPLSTEERVRIQGELSIVNAKIKALNTTSAAQLKAAADLRKVAGLTEAQANAARARARINGSRAPEHEDDDPGQTAAIDGWIDAVLMRYDVDFIRSATGTLTLTSPPVPRKLADAIELLVTGINAAARGQELPDLPPAATKVTKVPKTFTAFMAAKAAKVKPKKR